MWDINCVFKGSFWGEPDWKAGDSEDALARKAYEALLRVSLLQPTTDRFQEFTDEVKQRSLADYNFTINEDEEVSNFINWLVRIKLLLHH